MPTLKELREAKGWNQTELAHKSGVSIPTISRLENGRPVIKAVVAQIAQALGVKSEQITGVNYSNRVLRSARK